jgi:tetratricopeptide (TPR) repeat protein
MGTVYAAHDPVLGRMVAIKVFLSDLDLPDAVERFTREARSAAALNHANIVTTHDYGEFSSQPYIVMEYIQGETLTEIIRRKAPVSPAEKLRWIEELCTGVAYAHRVGVIHRDIKPTNLMIDRSGRLKILDFGIARMLGSLASHATALIGTPGYMAPEQILGGTIDYRSDLFSIGVVSYELLSYAEAFPGETLPAITHRILSDEPVPLIQLVPDINLELVDIVERLLKKSAEERFADAESLRVAITAVRRQFDSDSGGWDATAPTTVRSTPSGGGIKRDSGSQRRFEQNAVGVAQLTPPPDPNKTNREEIVRRRLSQIDASLVQARLLLAAGDLDASLEACVQALTIDDTYAEALELEQTIQTALARQRAGALILEARGELGRGALTGAQDLMQQARALDPDAPDVKRLERDLRLARVEQERIRQRALAVDKAIAAATRSLEQGEIEAALAFAREALELDPGSTKALAAEAAAMRRLDEETGAGSGESAPTILSGTPVPRPTGNAAGAGAAVAPTIIAKGVRRTPPPPVPQKPAAPQKKVTAPVLKGPRTDLRVRLRAFGTSVRPVVTSIGALVTSAKAAIDARPKREKMIVGWTALAVMLALVAIAGVILIPRSAPPMGTMMIEAVPWANITGIEAADGTRQALPSIASTPMSLNLPVGTYRVRLVGPPPDSESRLVTVQVNVGSVTTAPTERFRMLTPEEYFEQYLPSSTVPTSDPPLPVDPTAASAAVAPAASGNSPATAAGRGVTQ